MIYSQHLRHKQVILVFQELTGSPSNALSRWTVTRRSGSILDLKKRRYVSHDHVICQLGYVYRCVY